MEKTKICSFCHKEKPISAFYKHKNSLNGVRAYCKECSRKYYHKYYKKNQERIKKQGIEYYKKHRETAIAYSVNYKKRNDEKIKEKSLQYYQNNKQIMQQHSLEYYRERREEILEKRRKLMKEHPEKIKGYQDKYYKSHKKARNEYSRKWRINNLERDKKNSKEWAKNNPEKIAVYRQKKRALQSRSSGTHTPEDIKHLTSVQGGKCLMCGKRTKLSIDHIVPLSRGGRNDITNLQLLCKSCNSKKKATTKDFRSKKLIAKIFVQGDLFK